jgi:YD repeat-containing protein
VVFWGFASNLVPGGFGGFPLDIYVRDMSTGDIARVSTDANGVPGNNTSQSPSISADGKVITFMSSAGNLVPGDTNDKFDVYVAQNPFLGTVSVTNTVNRLGSETNANGATRKYNYDPLGNVTSITDRDGTVQRFTYDKLNRRIKEEWFDANNNLNRTINSTYNAASELIQIADPDSSYRYSFDQDGRMNTTNNLGTPGSPTTIMTYGYDNVGNVTSMTDSINGNIGVNNARQYDALNRLTVNNQGNKRVDYGYNAIGQ